MGYGIVLSRWDCLVAGAVIISVLCDLHVGSRMADLSIAPIPPSASGLSAPMSGLSTASVDPYVGMRDPASAAAAQRGFSAVRVAAPPPGVAAFGAAGALPPAAQLVTPSVAAPQLYTQYPWAPVWPTCVVAAVVVVVIVVVSAVWTVVVVVVVICCRLLYILAEFFAFSLSFLCRRHALSWLTNIVSSLQGCSSHGFLTRGINKTYYTFFTITQAQQLGGTHYCRTLSMDLWKSYRTLRLSLEVWTPGHTSQLRPCFLSILLY